MNRLSTKPSTVALIREAIGSSLDRLADAELLERFTHYSDHASFELILRRYGPMVLGVCRRLLANRHDAEEAFQATFLVLIRKAHSVRREERLGSWLYGVAVRVALKARGRLRQHVPVSDETDREAVQGLWVLERAIPTKALNPFKTEYAGVEGNLRIFIHCDTWWRIRSMGGNHSIQPGIATLDLEKKPKWLDVTDWRAEGEQARPDQLIDWLDQDKLHVVGPEDWRVRPAEFDPNDEQAKLVALVFRREPMPPPADVPALRGSWERSLMEFAAPGATASLVGNGGRPLTARVGVYDGFIFIGNLPGIGGRTDWIGGRYTVDTSRNPAGIDIQLFCPLPQGVDKLYGSYATTQDRLRLTLGVTGKRAARPMDFAPTEELPPAHIYFDLHRAALSPGERATTAPAPQARSEGAKSNERVGY
jgi:uncharacterized protein (TIGR03067 family)